MRPVRPVQRVALFDAAVSSSVARVRAHCPEALRGVDLGIEEVPPAAAWASEQIPLAAAIERTEAHPARVVVYRRPLEHRALSGRGLRILVHRTIVEQICALTGIPTETLDPTGYGDSDEED